MIYADAIIVMAVKYIGNLYLQNKFYFIVLI